jgi:hypothetical protein
VYLTHPEKPILEASLAEYLPCYGKYSSFVSSFSFSFSFPFLFLIFFLFFFFQVLFSDCKNPCKISKMREFSKKWRMSRRKPRETISVCGIVCGRFHSTGSCGALVAGLCVREIAELSCSQETTKPCFLFSG